MNRYFNKGDIKPQKKSKNNIIQEWKYPASKKTNKMKAINVLILISAAILWRKICGQTQLPQYSTRWVFDF